MSNNSSLFFDLNVDRFTCPELTSILLQNSKKQRQFDFQNLPVGQRLPEIHLTV